MQLHLGSYLSWYLPDQPSNLAIPLASPISLMELLVQLKLPPAEISVAAINGVLVSVHHACVADNDRVELHPPNGGG